MPKATSDNTPTDPGPYEGWAIGGLEPAINNLQATIGVFGHLVDAHTTVSADEWAKIEDELVLAAGQIKELWKAAFEQHVAEHREHKAALAAAEARKAAPGSAADLARVEALWTLMRGATQAAAQQCAEAGFPCELGEGSP